MARYNYHIATKEDGTPYKVICTSSFAGKTVRGVANCSQHDEFNLETGKQLAKLRCDVKVAQKRANKAKLDKDYLVAYMAEINKLLEKKVAYEEDSNQKLMAFNNELEKLLYQLK